MRFILGLIIVPVLALAVGFGVIYAERELLPGTQMAAVGTQVSVGGQPYVPVQILVDGKQSAASSLILEVPLNVPPSSIIAPAPVRLNDMTTGGSGKRVLKVDFSGAKASVTLLVPLIGIETEASVQLTTSGELNPGPFEDLGFGFFSGGEMQRALGITAAALVALLVFWLPGMVSRGLLRRKVARLSDEVEDERIRSARSQKEAKAAAARAEDRIHDIEVNAHAREEEAREAIAAAARLEATTGTPGGAAETLFWRETVREFLVAGGVSRSEVERMLRGISERMTEKESEDDSTEDESGAAPAAPEATESQPAPLVAEKDDTAAEEPAVPAQDAEEPQKSGSFLGRRRKRR